MTIVARICPPPFFPLTISALRNRKKVRATSSGRGGMADVPSAFLKKYAISYVGRERPPRGRAGMKEGRKAEKNSLWPSPAVDLSRSVDGRRSTAALVAVGGAADRSSRVSASSSASAPPSKKGIYSDSAVAAASASASGQTRRPHLEKLKSVPLPH